MREKTLSAQHYYEKGIENLEVGHYKDALTYFSLALKIAPNHRKALVCILVAKTYLGRYREAVEDATQALQHYPDGARLYNNRGTAKGGLKDFGGALADYDKALQIKPDYALCYLNRAGVKLDLNNFYGAKSDCDTALKIKPAISRLTHKAYVMRALIKARLDDYDGALKDLEKAEKLLLRHKGQWDQSNALLYRNEEIHRKQISKARKGVSFDEKIHTYTKDYPSSMSIDDYVNAILNLQLSTEMQLRLQMLQRCGYRYAEAAKVLGIPLKTLWVATRRVVQKLQKLSHEVK